VNISILCTDPAHSVINSLNTWIKAMSSIGHSISLLHDKTNLQGGDILFLVSCSQVVRITERNKYSVTLVLHASNLPQGRGWSPHIWSIIEGVNLITVSLIEAKEPVDSGAIWLQEKFKLEGHELLSEINDILYNVECSLMTQAVEKINGIIPIQQQGCPGLYLRKRTQEDSRMDPNKTIAEQFDLLRVVDSKRFPAFFDYRGKRYLIKIEKDER
jgi:methionyl-tRNA formyltransferase